jgi:hypothetical protein
MKIMKFLKRRTIWSNGELGLIKTSMASLGIVLGLYFSRYLEDFVGIFLAIFIVSAILTTLLWAGKMQK